ncbi:hypothetical protein HQ32_04422 [Prauserella sp. Am3]|nr:hypothetical protein HQ32_04422 [Prauserella sp. Am3]
MRDDHIQDRGYQRLRLKKPLGSRLLCAEPGERIEPRSEKIDAFFAEMENLRRLGVSSLEELLGIEAIADILDVLPEGHIGQVVGIDIYRGRRYPSLGLRSTERVRS